MSVFRQVTSKSEFSMRNVKQTGEREPTERSVECAILDLLSPSSTLFTEQTVTIFGDGNWRCALMSSTRKVNVLLVDGNGIKRFVVAAPVLGYTLYRIKCLSGRSCRL